MVLGLLDLLRSQKISYNAAKVKLRLNNVFFSKSINKAYITSKRVIDVSIYVGINNVDSTYMIQFKMGLTCIPI